MAVRTLTKPRKAASQARSRATVEALVEATARILVREGFERASTNRIAEAAGVSVGSLYQYFPSKDALVAAVIARHRHDLMGAARAALDAAAADPFEAGLRRLVAVAVDAHALDPDLHRVLAEQTPRAGAPEDVDVFDPQNFAVFRAWLEGHGEDLSGGLDLDLAAFICVTTIEAITHNAVLHRPQMLEGDGRERLVDEATRLVAGYLRQGPGVRP